jgi:hypothetical protein
MEAINNIAEITNILNFDIKSLNLKKVDYEERIRNLDEEVNRLSSILQGIETHKKSEVKEMEQAFNG